MTALTAPAGILGNQVIQGSEPHLTHRRQGPAEHDHTFGGLPAGIDPSWLDRQVRAVALTGRGGAHFPVANKWASAHRASVDGWTLVANGAEGEPASGKDAALLQLRPHLVLDGAEVAADMVGARRIVIWLAEQAGASVRSMRLAIAERALRPGPQPEVVTTNERYVSGESSSIIHAIQGGPALPRTTFDRGKSWAGGPPVLVHNVETLARLGLLARTGAEFHAASSLVTLTDGNRRLVIDVPSGETFAQMFAKAAVPAPQAVLLGGYGGEWVGWPELAGLLGRSAGVAGRRAVVGCRNSDHPAERPLWAAGNQPHHRMAGRGVDRPMWIVPVRPARGRHPRRAPGGAPEPTGPEAPARASRARRRPWRLQAARRCGADDP